MSGPAGRRTDGSTSDRMQKAVEAVELSERQLRLTPGCRTVGLSARQSHDLTHRCQPFDDLMAQTAKRARAPRQRGWRPGLAALTGAPDAQSGLAIP